MKEQPMATLAVAAAIAFALGALVKKWQAVSDNLFDRIPQWLKSLHEMENELRNAARKGLILRKDEATEHLAQARRHLEGALNEAKGVEPANGPQTPLRKEGEV
jgi:hypothetical protein